MPNQSIFITGTDTGIGKTTITAALLLALQQQGQSTGVCKPIETGVDNDCLDHSDTERLRHLLSPSLRSIRFACTHFLGLWPHWQLLAKQISRSSHLECIHMSRHSNKTIHTC